MSEEFAAKLAAVAYLMQRFGRQDMAARFFDAAAKLSEEPGYAQGLQLARAPPNKLAELNSPYPLTLVQTLSKLAERRSTIDAELCHAAHSSAGANDVNLVRIAATLAAEAKLVCAEACNF